MRDDLPIFSNPDYTKCFSLNLYFGHPDIVDLGKKEKQKEKEKQNKTKQNKKNMKKSVACFDVTC